MNVSLTPELEQFIQSQIESGRYASSDELIIAGIKLLEERDRLKKRSIWRAAINTDRGEVVDGERVLRELQQKLQQRRSSKDWSCLTN